MAGGNNDVLSEEHRSVIEEHGVITFVAQIPGGKSKPAREGVRGRGGEAGQTYWMVGGSFVRGFLSYFFSRANGGVCDLAGNLPILPRHRDTRVSRGSAINFEAT